MAIGAGVFDGFAFGVEVAEASVVSDAEDFALAGEDGSDEWVWFDEAYGAGCGAGCEIEEAFVEVWVHGGRLREAEEAGAGRGVEEVVGVGEPAASVGGVACGCAEAGLLLAPVGVEAGHGEFADEFGGHGGKGDGEVLLFGFGHEGDLCAFVEGVSAEAFVLFEDGCVASACDVREGFCVVLPAALAIAGDADLSGVVEGEDVFDELA